MGRFRIVYSYEVTFPGNTLDEVQDMAGHNPLALLEEMTVEQVDGRNREVTLSDGDTLAVTVEEIPA